MTPRRCLKTLVVAIGAFAPWLLLQAVSAPPVVAQDITVSLADPSAAPQGTVNLNVIIKGKGFKRGAMSKFLVAATDDDPGGVTVKSTTFVNSTELVANVDIAETATLSKFDIKVQNADGRTGKGIELFTVTEKGSGENPSGPSPVAADFSDASGDGVMSDGRGYLLPPGCGDFDYVDVNDPCEPSVSTVSDTRSGYFLRTVSNLDPLTVDRWLVLDFSRREQGYECPDLDTQLIEEVNGSPDPGVLPPRDPAQCIDFVEVRLVAEGAFQRGVESTTVNMLIDTPVRYIGKGKKGQPYTQWDARFILNSVNPLSLSYGPSGEAIVGAAGDDFRFELWTFDQRRGTFGDFLGIYTMPLELTLMKRP